TLLSAKYADRANDLADYAPPASGLIDEIALISRSDEYLLKQIDNAVRSSNDQWALALCNQAMKYYPANKELVSHVFFIYLRMGNKEKVLTYLPEHFALFQKETRELMDAMDFLYNNGLYNEALQYFNQARKLLPKNSSLITWLYDRGKKQEAINLLIELVKNNPQDEKILADLVHVIADTGDDEMAGQYYAKLKSMAPNSAETLQLQGLFAERAGDAPAAMAAYEQAYRLGATDLISMKELAKTAARNQYWPKAIEYFNRALKKYPNDPELLDRMGRLLIGCADTAFRNVPEGLEYLERTFVHVNSSNKTKLATGKMIAALCISMGDKKKAAQFINRTITLAEQQQQSEEYIAYFKTLVSKKQ
ncbi:MAG: tetratricopeptide repeat protein, partial [Ferruginibacter sp.]